MSSIQYVVFSLDNEEYGLEISSIQEIIRIPQHINKIPNMPSYIEGIINLRGKVIPIIDLRKRFGLERIERSIENRLLILNLENTLLGIIVDDISEVLKIDDQSIEKLSSEISCISRNSVKGVGKVDDRLILLLDTIKLKTEMF